jgi:integrase
MPSAPHDPSTPKKRVGARPAEKAIAKVQGVTLVDGLRLRGDTFQADFRNWGRGQPRLTDPQSGLRVTDPTVANRLYLTLCKQYEQEQKAIGNGELSPRDVTARRAAEAKRLAPKAYSLQYIADLTDRSEKERAGKPDEYVRGVGRHLARIVDETSFKDLKSIQQIDRREVGELVRQLLRMKRAHPKPYPDDFARLGPEEWKKATATFDAEHNLLSPATVRVMMMALSGMITHAIDNNDYHKGNPVSRHKMVPPQYEYHEASFLEIAQAGLLLEVLESQVGHHRNRFAYEMLAVLLYTGMRVTEMFRMAPWHVDFEGDRILVYSLKKSKKAQNRPPRTVPLWPALRQILLAFYKREGLLENPRRRQLLFPGRPLKGKNSQVKEQPRQSIARLLARVGKDAGIDIHIHAHLTRHTYAAARLSMVNNVNGRLVNVTKHEVAKELGHDGERMLDQVYGHVLLGRYAMTELDYSSSPQLNPNVARAVI